MLKTLLKQVKQYTLASILTPLFMIGEVICEMIIPVLMARIVDIGIYGNNMGYIFSTGGKMIVIAVLGLLAGLLGAYYGSMASTGFAKNLRKAMFDNIQTFSFSNIDKFSSSGLVTRLTTDVQYVQQAFQMSIRIAIRAPLMLIFSFIMVVKINPSISTIFLVLIPVLLITLLELLPPPAKPAYIPNPKNQILINNIKFIIK